MIEGMMTSIKGSIWLKDAGTTGPTDVVYPEI